MMILGWLLAALQILTRIFAGSFGNKLKVPEEASLIDLTTDLIPDVAMMVGFRRTSVVSLVWGKIAVGSDFATSEGKLTAFRKSGSWKKLSRFKIPVMMIR